MKKIITLAYILFAFQLHATEIKPNSIPLGSVYGSNGMVFPKNKFAVSVKTIFVKKENIYDGNSKILNASNKKSRAINHKLILRYGLGSNFDVRMIVPYVDKSMSMDKGSTSGDFDNSGLGDVRILSRYQLTSPKLGNSFYSAIGIGMELPTGSSDKDFSWANGKILPNHRPDGMQNGNGAYNPIIEIAMTKPMPHSRFDFSSMYLFNQEGDNNFKKGDHLAYNVGYSYKLHAKFMPSIELNGRVSEKNTKEGIKVSNTGGHELFLTPGFSSSVSKKFKLFAGVALPIYRDLNREALGTDIRVITKICYSW